MEQMQKQIEELQKEKEEMFAKLQRMAADYDNFRKLRLQGEAVIERVDGANRGIALEFRKPLRQFERIDKLGLH